MADRQIRGQGLPWRTRLKINQAVIDKIQPNVDAIAAQEFGAGRLNSYTILNSMDRETGRVSWSIPQDLADTAWGETQDDYVDWGEVIFDLTEDFRGSVGVRLHRGEEDRLKGGLGLADLLARAIKRSGGGGINPREGT